MDGTPRNSVEASDGATVDVTLYRAAHRESADPPPALIWLPAMGVKASYYSPWAQALSERGCDVVTADLRGLGTSSVRAGRDTDFGYRELVEVDLPAIVQRVRSELPDSKIYLGGHSLGGQMACLYAAAEPEEISGLILVASCSVYYRGWPFPGNLVLLGFQQLAWIAAQIVGHFPGHTVHFGGREARGVMRDWARQGRTGRYEPAGSNRDYEALLAALERPVTAFSFTDDTYCTQAATRNLLAKMSSAPRTHYHLSPDELGTARIGHFSWTKQAELLAPRVAESLSQAPS